MADAYRQLGEYARADRLDRAADRLYRLFNERFWLPESGNFALALQGVGGAKRPAAVDASNQGQALWSGIVDPARAGAVRDSLLDPARLFAGWGVRTLSRTAVAYNPFDYQTGAIWPHDNALIGAGLRDYGFDEAALAIFTGLYEAATRFEHYRLPELFAGFSQDDYGVPVRYPVACSPQAWSAGSLPYLLQAILGLAPTAFAGRLEVVRPRLPRWLDWVDLRGVRVGAGRVDLRYERSGADTLTAVVRKEGDLDVAIIY
jgi:glycogen debranching enzyme